jgi:hypothetical protein
MDRLMHTEPFRRWAQLAIWHVMDPPLFHSLGSVCSCITNQDSAIENVLRGVTIRVGNDLHGPYVLVWKHREVFPGNERYVELVLLRHSEDNHNTVFLRLPVRTAASRAISLALHLIEQE